MGESVIRVMVVDDYHIVRQGITVVIESADDLELVGEAKDGSEAVHLCLVQPGVNMSPVIKLQEDDQHKST